MNRTTDILIAYEISPERPTKEDPKKIFKTIKFWDPVNKCKCNTHVVLSFGNYKNYWKKLDRKFQDPATDLDQVAFALTGNFRYQDIDRIDADSGGGMSIGEITVQDFERLYNQ